MEQAKRGFEAGFLLLFQPHGGEQHAVFVRVCKRLHKRSHEREQFIQIGFRLLRRGELVARAARSDGLQHRAGLLARQDEKCVARRLLEHLEQRVLRRGVELVRMPQNDGAAVAVVRQHADLLPDFARKRNRQVVFAFVDDIEIRMGAVLQLVAGRACPTGAFAVPRTQEGGGQRARHLHFAAAGRPGQQNSLRKPAFERRAQAVLDGFVAWDGVKTAH